ncbi:MAG: hypothetical protein JWN37_382 [Candidatus Nomurabacteria bacterium]|nr:hypothetical protein [Candidatus Nomurabacteria bacterium]
MTKSIKINQIQGMGKYLRSRTLMYGDESIGIYNAVVGYFN